MCAYQKNSFKPFTIVDKDSNVFRTNMVKYAHNMVEGNIEPLLSDAFSYELLVMLNRNVVDIYSDRIGVQRNPIL